MVVMREKSRQPTIDPQLEIIILPVQSVKPPYPFVTHRPVVLIGDADDGRNQPSQRGFLVKFDDGMVGVDSGAYAARHPCCGIVLADILGGMAGTAHHEQDCRRQCGCLD